MHPEVYVSNRNQYVAYATGSMVDARYSADSCQSIGCEIRLSRPRCPLYLTCIVLLSIARTSILHCRWSNDPEDIETVQAMTDSSYIYFEPADRSTRKVRQPHDLQWFRQPQISDDAGFAHVERELETCPVNNILYLLRKENDLMKAYATETHRYGECLGLALCLE